MLKKVILDESGRALALTLVILGIGVLLIPVFLSHASTNLSATRAIEEGFKEQYAADAGVEYALYMLANNATVPFSTNTPTLANNIPVSVTVESESVYYKITSTAQDTAIRSYVAYTPGGNLDFYEGALVSAGDITLAKDCTVDGDIRVGNGYTLTVTYPFTHTGGSLVQQEITFPSSDEFVQTYQEEALVGGTYTGTMSIDSSSTLGPLYIAGDLYVGMYSVITLTGSIYVEGNIWAQKDSEFRGTGSIIAGGDIHMQKVTGFGTDSDSVIMSINGDISFDKEAILEALIYAPNGLIQFDKDSSVTGAVVGAEISAHKLELFAYDASFYDGFRLPGYQEAGFRVWTYNINP